MIGQQLGAYTLEAELGSGGMGSVYRASGPDGPVAIKIVHPHLLDSPGFYQRFLREAEIGRRVDHPNVVHTLDCDSRDGRHFLVTEYVKGRSLRELLSDLGTIPESLVREIALQTAAGLAAIHEQGIIHRDIKPENLLITDEHEVRIMDLGVAKLQEATIELTREGQFAGSLLYAAPEQFRAELEVGPASDLYSLGVLLYELATGDNPFRRDDVAQVVSAHLQFEPVRPEEVSGYLAELMAKLLSKEPERRFESAARVLHILQRGESATWWSELAAGIERSRVAKIRVRRETSLQGREDELAHLREAWAQALRGEGSTLWIEGEAGIGKSRLLAEFVESLAGGAQVLYGSYPPSGGLGGFSDAIVDHFGEIDLDVRLRPYLSTTPALVPAFAALLKRDAPPDGAQPIQGDALHAVGVNLMRALAAERPTLWIIEDLQFAPKESRDLSLSLARAVQDHGILLVCTSRPGVGGEELAHFDRLDRFQRITLGRLGGREIMDLLEEAFRSEALAEKLGGRVARKSDGVPFFVFEMIRGLKEGQFIRQAPDGSYIQTRVVEEIEVPSAVKDLIEGRLKGLTEQQRAILDVGAVQGMEFDPGLVSKVLDEKRIRVLRDLAEIERRYGLIRDDGAAVRFDQNQIQEVLYGSLTPHLRAEYHALFAEAYEGEDPVFLAHHHLHGSRPRDGLPHLTPALTALAASFRNDEHVDLARRALDAPKLLEGQERARLLLLLARRLHHQGRRDEERPVLDEAIAISGGGDDLALQAEAKHRMGEMFLALTDPDAARSVLEESRSLARAAGSLDREADATLSLGQLAMSLGSYEESERCFARSRSLSLDVGDREREAIAIGNLAIVAHITGDHAEAQELLECALAIAHELGDRVLESRAVANIGVVLLNVGRYTEAREHFERHLSLARELGFRESEAQAISNLGSVRSVLGDPGEALRAFDRRLLLARELGDRQGEAFAMGTLADAFLDLGLYTESQAQYERSLAMARELGDLRLVGYALQGLGCAAHAQERTEEALNYHQEALALRREMGVRGNIGLSQYLIGLLEVESEELESAAARFEEALAIARETKEPGAILNVVVAQAGLPGGSVSAALEAFAEHGEQTSVMARLFFRFRLFEFTGDRSHLDEAHRLLCFVRDHAPEEYRTSMIENVSLHREIMKAWDDRN